MMIELPTPDSIDAIADWIELRLAITEERLSKAKVASDIESLCGDEPPDHRITTVWAELSRRQNLYSKGYFAVNGNTIERVSVHEKTEYVYCLLLSLYGVESDANLSGRLFERLVRGAVEKYLSGKALVFGWPFEQKNDSNQSLTTRLGLQIQNIADQLNERFVEPPPNKFKDRGVDIIGWIEFGDSRSGQVVILLQSAAGHNWKGKAPVPEKSWSQYIHWACNPAIAFAVPCVITKNDWHEVSREKGILFDRIRILNLLSNAVSDRQLNIELVEWINNQYSRLDIKV
ncbi:MAG: hypothetical protein HC853_04800 [Anaerolineae bacterium]|nr:hypothetical protein [Anaerolineae bacterium]